MDEGQRFAYWYDLDQGGYEEDLPFYLGLARRTGSPILELGCGTGRLALALARAGHQVTGVDNLPAMLERAREKASAAGTQVAGRLRLLQQDMRLLDLPERFRLAILAVNTWMHLCDPGQQADLLERVFLHLLPGGLLVLDLFHPHPQALLPGEGEVYLEKTLSDPLTGRVALKFVARRADYAAQTITTTFLYDEVDAGGRLTRTVATFPLRYLHRPEAEALLLAAGFGIEGVYGTYGLDPYQDEAERMLFLARRP